MRAPSDNSSDQDLQGYEPVISPGTGPISSATELTVPYHDGRPRRQPTAMSYYSASDIPEPDSAPYVASPRRPNLTLHPSSAEQRRVSQTKPSPLSPSMAPLAPRGQSPISPISPVPATSPTRQATASPGRLSPSATGGEYEMTLRPRHTPEPSYQSHTSQASFITAPDGDWESENDDRGTVRGHGRAY